MMCVDIHTLKRLLGAEVSSKERASLDAPPQELQSRLSLLSDVANQRACVATVISAPVHLRGWGTGVHVPREAAHSARREKISVSKCHQPIWGYRGAHRRGAAAFACPFSRSPFPLGWQSEHVPLVSITTTASSTPRMASSSIATNTNCIEGVGLSPSADALFYLFRFTHQCEFAIGIQTCTYRAAYKASYASCGHSSHIRGDACTAPSSTCQP